jgi:uncharacterized iron-regulated protein
MPCLNANIARLVFLFAIVRIAGAQDTTPVRIPHIVDNKTGKVIELKEMVSAAANYDVIFLGEIHDNDAGHQFQLDVIRGLVESGRDIAISTEQFERDVQGAVDDYLADRITEEAFLAASRPWKNYPFHYRPIIELGKKHKIPVIAGNLPRRLAAILAADQPIAAHEQVFAARSRTPQPDLYWTNFVASMKDHAGAESPEKIKSFYAAQCAKDDAMAEAIADFMAVNRHRPRIVVHLCGQFHSDYGLGTAFAVAPRHPLLRSAIVTMELIPKTGSPDLQAVNDRAHFTFWTVENPPSDAGQASNSKSTAAQKE